MTVHRMCRRAAGVLAASLIAGSGVLRSADGRLNFVSCPIVRDTASVPCWLSEYKGELYFLTIQSDVSAPVTPPWLGHRVLVEGSISNEPRICGGVVLEPVHLSVLPERDASCNTMLPAEEQYNLTFEPPRPPGPSKGRLAFDAPAGPAPAAPTAAPTPAPTQIVVPYDFDGLVGFSHPRYLTQALSAARALNARTIEIVGYRGAVRLSDGQTMVEAPDIGKRRAEQVAMLLKGAGLTAPSYTVRWQEQAARATGEDDYLARRVIITLGR
jgi:hypothetical protein